MHSSFRRLDARTRAKPTRVRFTLLVGLLYGPSLKGGSQRQPQRSIRYFSQISTPILHQYTMRYNILSLKHRKENNKHHSISTSHRRSSHRIIIQKSFAQVMHRHLPPRHLPNFFQTIHRFYFASRLTGYEWAHECQNCF